MQADIVRPADALSRTVEGAVPGLLAIMEWEAGEAPEPGAWSPKQVIGHLVDSATNNHRRFVLAQLQDALVFEGYEQDDWAGALSHYTALIDAEPDNAAWLHGQARSQKRLGFHRGEISTWIRVLELAPDDVHAMGNRAVAHARLGDYEAADYWLVRMRGADSDDPYLYVFEAMVSAIEGDDDTALVLLEQTIASRHELPDGLQVELRRDLALDPALGSLRGDDRLQRMLSRQYGADRPRRLR